MMEPRVGILIPTYNRAEYLREALESVLGQSYSALHIIVIDNGSTDATPSYMQSVSDPRVRYVVNEENLGPIGSINRGIMFFSSEVEWCTVLCDDDYFDKDFIKSMVHLISTANVKAVVHGHKLLVDATGRLLRDAHPAPPSESPLEYIRNRSKLKRETFLTGIFFSRARFDEIGGYPLFTTGTATDDAFIFALAMGDKLYFNKDAIACIRMHSGAESFETSKTINQLLSLNDFVKYLTDFQENNNDITRTMLEELNKYKKNYVKHLNSYLWLRTVRTLFKNRDEKSQQELVELYKVVINKQHDFSFIVKFDVFCAVRFGYCPEANGLYRYCAELIDRFANRMK
jgi:glycosyltransferase involved in cell wall biosynthesis